MANKIETYAESKGKEPFNWSEFLKKKEFSKEELYEAESLVGCWATCGVGIQSNFIDRGSDGKPSDKELALLGVDFTNKVTDMYENRGDSEIVNYHRKDAITYLNKIEKRCAYLIEKKLDGYKTILESFNYKVTK